MANREVFVDTHAFYCVMSRNDRQHDRAKSLLQSMTAVPVTTDWIVGETVNLLTARRKHHVAMRFLDYLDASDGLRIVHVDAARFDRARELIRVHREHEFPFTDCTSFVVMKEFGMHDVLTNDRHFRIMGFNPLLAD
ncbi:MAG: type II toxin-antitoxin system VapC family toxin [Verrucomicrobiales bacterium]